MDSAKQARLEAQGWRTGTVAELLGLTPEESEYIEIKLALSHALRAYQTKKKHRTRSRMAKADAGDASVSLDLLIQSLLALGATRADLARIIADDSAAV